MKSGIQNPEVRSQNNKAETTFTDFLSFFYSEFWILAPEFCLKNYVY
jgi:hypothetical protein